MLIDDYAELRHLANTIQRAWSAPASLDEIIEMPLNLPRRTDTIPRLIMLVGEGNVPALIASLRSMFMNGVIPGAVSVVSDGSLKDTTRKRIERFIGHLPHCAVDTRRDLEHFLREAPQPIRNLAQAARDAEERAVADGNPVDASNHRMAGIMTRKFAMEYQLAAGDVYSDSDVLYGPEAIALIDELAHGQGQYSYNRDIGPYYDRRIISLEAVQAIPVDGDVNAGLLVVRRAPDWSESIKGLEGIASPRFFTEQTAVALAAAPNQARPLDPRRFIVIGEATMPDDLDWLQDPRFASLHCPTPVRWAFRVGLAMQAPELLESVASPDLIQRVMGKQELRPVSEWVVRPRSTKAEAESDRR
jgi:hypothetical protein